MKKKLRALILLAVLLSVYTAAVALTGTHAFTVIEDTTHNIITTDGIDITLEEWRETADGLEPFLEDTPVEFLPNVTVSKIVKVRNHERDAHVRIRCDFEIIGEDGKAIVLDSETLANTVVLDYNTENYTYSDGWWYYTAPLTKGEVSEPLFTEVYFPPEYVDNRYQGAKLTIKVTACAVQADNNGATPLDAAGWPAY